MPTEVIDANNPQTPVPAPALLDAEAFAGAISRQLAQTLKQQSTPAEKRDAIADSVAQMKAMGVPDGDIQAHITGMLAVQKQSREEIEERVQKEREQFLNNQYRKELTSAIGRVVRSYSKEDELVAVSAPAIKEQIWAEFWQGTSGPIVTARNRFLSGNDLDEDVLDEIAQRQIKRIEQAVEKRSGKKSQATPTLTASDTPARPAESGKSADANNLTVAQQTAYDMVMKAGLRTGNRDKDFVESLKSRALKAASAVKK